MSLWEKKEEKKTLLYQKWEYAQPPDIVHKSSKALLKASWQNAEIAYTSAIIYEQKKSYTWEVVIHFLSVTGFSSTYLTLVPGKQNTWRARPLIWSAVAFPTFLRKKSREIKCTTLFLKATFNFSDRSTDEVYLSIYIVSYICLLFLSILLFFIY